MGETPGSSGSIWWPVGRLTPHLETSGSQGPAPPVLLGARRTRPVSTTLILLRPRCPSRLGLRSGRHAARGSILCGERRRRSFRTWTCGSGGPFWQVLLLPNAAFSPQFTSWALATSSGGESCGPACSSRRPQPPLGTFSGPACGTCQGHVSERDCLSGRFHVCEVCSKAGCSKPVGLMLVLLRAQLLQQTGLDSFPRI